MVGSVDRHAQPDQPDPGGRPDAAREQPIQHDDGPDDESLRRDFSWKFTPVIVEWERGDFGEELVEVSHEQAEKIIEYFRGRWGAGEPGGA